MEALPHAFLACRRESRARSLLELEELARSAGAEIAGTVFQLREAADPRDAGRPREIG